MPEQRGTFHYDHDDALWTSVALVTVVSLLAHALVGVVEAAALARFGPAPSRA